MDYKGYHIIAEINVNSQWDFDADDDGNIELTSNLGEGDADEDNLADFLVQDPEGDEVDWADDLEGAKALIDADIAKTKQAEKGDMPQ